MVSNSVEQAVFQAVEETNQIAPPHRQLGLSRETVVSGSGARLDSLGFVNLVLAVERVVEQSFGETVSLANPDVLALNDSPFRTLGTLIDYIAMHLETADGG